jgi:hypothetical protein
MTRLQRNHFYVKSYVESHKILFQKISMIIDAYVHSCVLSISKLLIIVHSYIALTAWCSGHRFLPPPLPIKKLILAFSNDGGPHIAILHPRLLSIYSLERGKGKAQVSPSVH